MPKQEQTCRSDIPVKEGPCAHTYLPLPLTQIALAIYARRVCMVSEIAWLETEGAKRCPTKNLRFASWLMPFSEALHATPLSHQGVDAGPQEIGRHPMLPFGAPGHNTCNLRFWFWHLPACHCSERRQVVRTQFQSWMSCEHGSAALVCLTILSTMKVCSQARARTRAHPSQSCNPRPAPMPRAAYVGLANPKLLNASLSSSKLGAQS